MEKLRSNPPIVLIIHGFASHKERYFELKKVIEECYPGAEPIIHDFSLPLFSTAKPNKIVNDLLTILDDAWKEAIAKRQPEEPLPEIIIIGHSAGCLLARKLYLVARGESQNCPFEHDVVNKHPKDWVKQVTRVILLAGINNGWTTTQHLNNTRAVGISIGIILGHIVEFFSGKKLFAFQVRKGSPFISNLRLQWIWMKKESLIKNMQEPLTIQLLGTVDDVVPPDNNIDIYSGSNFIYLELPYSGHINILEMDDSLKGLSDEEIIKRRARAAVIKDALLKNRDELLKQQKDTVGDISAKEQHDITDVVFVIHGIRDTAYWTEKLANRIRAYGYKEGRKFATEASSYGYFSMLQFLLLGKRIAKMEWLVDQYIENLALYPNAHDNFSFFGHSNGTYLLAAAFKRYPAIKFKNVVLAGSVVHQSFDWNQLKDQGRITNYFNLTATNDWVVGIFPKAFEKLPFMDLGAGGFDGFKSMPVNSQLKYIKGGHGEGTTEKYWDEIAYFIVHGKATNDASAFVPFKRPVIWRIVGYTAPLPFLAIFAGIIILGVYIFIWLPDCKFNLENKILIELLYIFVIWKLITKF
ncbi:MAG: alpha/beta hydrolase [Ginsengibacter sp.]